MKLFEFFLLKALGIKLTDSLNLQKALKNTSWLFLDNVIRLIVGLFVMTAIARYFGPTQFGVWSYCISFIALFNALSTFGLDNIVVRNLVRSPNEYNEILGTAFVLKILSGIGTFLLLITSFFLLKNDNEIKTVLLIILAGGMFIQAFDVIDFYFQSQVQSKYTVLSKSIAFLLSTLLNITCLVNHAPIIVFAYIKLAESIFNTLGLLFVYYLKKHSIQSWCFKIEKAKNLLKDCFPTIIASFATMIQSYFDQIILSNFKGDFELGQYSASLQIITVFAFMPMMIVSSVSPIITNTKKTDKNLYEQQLFHVYKLMWFLFILIALPLIFFAHPITSLLYGDKYHFAGTLLSVMVFRLFFACMGVARNIFLVNESLFVYSLFPTSLGALINIGLNYILIPKYGSFGAIFSMIFSFATTLYVVDLWYPKTRSNAKMMLYAVFAPFKSYKNLNFKG